MRHAVVVALWALTGALAAEEILIVEQSYNVVKAKAEETKDIRQKIYMSGQSIRIDEYAGQGKAPSETYLIDLKKETIVNLDNENLTKVTETFEKRRARIEDRKTKAREDLANVPEGAQKDKLVKLYKALLDEGRPFELTKNKDEKEIAGAKAESFWVVDEKEREYVPVKAWLHKDQEVPYDSAEVLYLLQIIGGEMKGFLAKNKKVFRRLPLEMELDLAAGGMLRTKVLSVVTTPREQLDKGIFTVPDDYKEKAAGRPKPPPVAKTVEPD